MGPVMPQPRRGAVPAAADPLGGVELIGCPQCSAPASIVAGVGMPCTDGGAGRVAHVEHVRVWCAAGHWFLMPRDMLEPA